VDKIEGPGRRTRRRAVGKRRASIAPPPIIAIEGLSEVWVHGKEANPMEVASQVSSCYTYEMQVYQEEI
jgi:hypothetical protein